VKLGMVLVRSQRTKDNLTVPLKQKILSQTVPDFRNSLNRKVRFRTEHSRKKCVENK